MLWHSRVSLAVIFSSIQTHILNLSVNLSLYCFTKYEDINNINLILNMAAILEPPFKASSKQCLIDIANFSWRNFYGDLYYVLSVKDEAWVP